MEVDQCTTWMRTNILLLYQKKYCFRRFISWRNSAGYVSGCLRQMLVPYLAIQIWKRWDGRIRKHDMEAYQYPCTVPGKFFFPSIHIVLQYTRMCYWVLRSDSGTLPGYAHLETTEWNNPVLRHRGGRKSSYGTSKSVVSFASYRGTMHPHMVLGP